eukprot:Phypoly_transcript_17798.p1 GENE.Phypoly_transcript_17798~~Phypoly_transcript_17798.p1  ORF type:complete len:235 (+),score=27.21 Phypoly_transcript_17798:31-705(+)
MTRICWSISLLLALTCGYNLPVWPNQAITNWTIYNAPPSPIPNLYVDGIPPPPYSAGRGMTYYDWSFKAMREVYLDFCVPIFPNGSNWKCDFLNVNATSYLIMYDDRPQGQPECCVFEEPWYPPAPNFLQVSNAVPNGTGTVWGQPVEWFFIDVSADFGGPFGYSYFTSPLSPSSFYFGGVTGWILQQYQNFTDAKPSFDVWKIPPACLGAPNCTLTATSFLKM